MIAKDGAHYPSKAFKENFDSIFKKDKKKIKLAPKTTKQFLEGMKDGQTNDRI